MISLFFISIDIFPDFNAFLLPPPQNTPHHIAVHKCHWICVKRCLSKALSVIFTCIIFYSRLHACKRFALFALRERVQKRRKHRASVMMCTGTKDIRITLCYLKVVGTGKYIAVWSFVFPGDVINFMLLLFQFPLERIKEREGKNCKSSEPWTEQKLNFLAKYFFRWNGENSRIELSCFCKIISERFN